MRVLVIHAHPVPESFNGALNAAVVESLTEAGHTVEMRDLYAEGFAAALSAEERHRYHTIPDNLAGVEDHVAALRRCEALVLVFPTWWYGLPAILKGWFDRVWVPGVAFHLPEGGGPIRPGLANIAKFGVVTTAGAPAWFTWFYMGHPNKKMLFRGLKILCAPRAEASWLCHYNMDTATPESLQRFLAKVRMVYRRF